MAADRGSRRWMAGRWVVAGSAAATIGLVASAVVFGGAGTARAGELPAFEDCDALRSWYASAAEPYVGPWGFDGSWGGGMERAVDVGAPMAVTADAGSSAGAASPERAPAMDAAVGNGATGTNVQEQGVDEPDLVKTDGRLLLMLHEQVLTVVDVSGDRPRVEGRLRMVDSAPSELLLVGDRAVVLGSGDSVGPTPADSRMSPAPMSLRAVITVVDLADPGNPEVLRTEEVDGSVLSARERDGIVRVVISHSPSLPFPEPVELYADPAATSGAIEKAHLEAVQANLQVVRSARAQDWLPQRIVRDGNGDVRTREPLLGCDDVRHPRTASGVGTLAVLTLDPRDAGASDATTAVTADGNLVYASADRLYVATMRGGWGTWGGPAELGIVPERGRQRQASTDLHAFDITGRQSARYVASGSVDGTLLSSWAMSEQDGLLRVATTRSRADRPSDNAVTVLAERGARLVPLGSVGGLGVNEQIQAVRWFGDLAVVVTFRQTDPLYTVDLSDPRAPEVRGELKIPGFSAYLHPLGDGMLLGVGQDADASGRTLGVQVSSFDLTDLDDPRRTATEDLAPGPGGTDSWSEVQADSRAFTYLPDRRLAVLPVESFGATWRSGLVAVHVAADGTLETVGTWAANVGMDSTGGMGGVRRAVPLTGGRLAAITGDAVTILDADDLSELGTASLGGR